MFSDYTTNGPTYSNIVVIRVSYRDTSTPTSTYSTAPTAEFWSHNLPTQTSPPIKYPRIVTEKMLRDMAAAKAHADFIAESVRRPPLKYPTNTEKQHRQGYYDGPRFSAHTATRTR